MDRQARAEAWELASPKGSEAREVAIAGVIRDRTAVNILTRRREDAKEEKGVRPGYATPRQAYADFSSRLVPSRAHQNIPVEALRSRLKRSASAS